MGHRAGKPRKTIYLTTNHREQGAVKGGLLIVSNDNWGTQGKQQPEKVGVAVEQETITSEAKRRACLTKKAVIVSIGVRPGALAVNRINSHNQRLC